MKKQEKIFKIENIERRKLSIYGNPAYSVYMRDCENNLYIAKTASNAAAGYEVSNYLYKNALITYHYTRAGNMIIDYVREAK